MRVTFGKVFIGLFLLLIIGLGVRIATYEKPFKPTSPWETSSETVEAKMEGITFNIPGNYLRSLLEKSKVRPDELSDGFNMHALLPDFAPFSYEEKEAFIEGGPDSRVLYINISRACFLAAPGRGAPPDCTAASTMSIHFDVYSSPQLPKEVVADAVVDVIDGLDFYGIQSSDVIKKKGQLINDIYTAQDKNGQLVFLSCGRIGSVPNPTCKLRFIWNDRFLINVRFGRNQRFDWANIKSGTEKLITSFVAYDTLTPGLKH